MEKTIEKISLLKNVCINAAKLQQNLRQTATNTITETMAALGVNSFDISSANLKMDYSEIDGCPSMVDIAYIELKKDGLLYVTDYSTQYFMLLSELAFHCYGDILEAINECLTDFDIE